MHRGFFLSFAALGAMVASASAADLPSAKGPPAYVPPPPPATWTGLYVGLNAGWGSQNSNGSSLCLDDAGIPNGATCHIFPNIDVNGGGFIGGGQIGYNWQVDHIVVGVETDFQGTTIAGSNSVTGPVSFPGGGSTVQGTISASQRLDWLGTARLRLGYAFGPSLIYATGGLAYGQDHLSTTSLFNASGIFYPATGVTTHVGWVAGGGYEYAFGRGWSAKIEGLYYDLGNQTLWGGEVPLVSPLAAHGRAFDSLGGAIVRVGLNYKFDFLASPAPVVAKY